jgi:hypothetical protein
MFMYQRRILCTLNGAVDFQIVLKRRAVWVGWGVQVRNVTLRTSGGGWVG